MKAVFVTKFTVAPGANGWHTGQYDAEALVIQGDDTPYIPCHPTPDLCRKVSAELVRVPQIHPPNRVVDLIVIYPQHMALADIEALLRAYRYEEVVFVGCACLVDWWYDIQRLPSLANGWYIHGDCGGVRTMRRIYTNFIRTGQVMKYTTLAEAFAARELEQIAARERRS